MRAYVLSVGRAVRWYLKAVTGEAKWDEYLEGCRIDGVQPISRRTSSDTGPSTTSSAHGPAAADLAGGHECMPTCGARSAAAAILRCMPPKTTPWNGLMSTQ